MDADVVVYGKTLGGGLANGVVCGPSRLMKRFDETRPLRVAYVIGTFAGHPAVMGSMNAFLKWHARPGIGGEYAAWHGRIDAFVHKANREFEKQGYPVQLANWFSVWSILYTRPGRYHWMFQYYLRDAGISLSWVGSGRLLFSIDWTDAHFDDLLSRMLSACAAMDAGGWWVAPRVNVKKALGLEFVGAIVKFLLGFL